MRRPSVLLSALAASSALALAACSGGDQAPPAESSGAVSASGVVSDPTLAGSIVPSPTSSGQPAASSSATSATSATTAPTAVSRATPVTDPPADAGVDPADGTGDETGDEAGDGIGVPGLDSDDAFCAAWSRFGGTWQVLAVGSTFLGDPGRVARWEVSSAPLVVGAYDELFAHLPEQLARERETLADGYFGAFERRARAASDALFAAGANGDDVAALSRAWLDALAARDPSDPAVPFAEPDALVALVDAASTELRRQRIEFHLDPSLIVTVETPLTDAFLEAECPDQGTLAGGEVEG